MKWTTIALAAAALLHVPATASADLIPADLDAPGDPASSPPPPAEEPARSGCSRRNVASSVGIDAAALALSCGALALWSRRGGKRRLRAQPA